MTWGLVEVHEFADVERVRQIRNTCRAFMTRDTHEITEQEQLVWWTTRRFDLRLFLFQLEGEGVGYGLTQLAPDGALVLSGGLHPEYRGMGIGLALFGLLALTGLPRRRCVCRLEVRQDNMAARVTYEKLGFGYVGERPTTPSGVLVMENTFL